MKTYFFCFLLVSSFSSIAQNLTQEETVDYINKKLFENRYDGDLYQISINHKYLIIEIEYSLKDYQRKLNQPQNTETIKLSINAIVDGGIKLSKGINEIFFFSNHTYYTAITRLSNFSKIPTQDYPLSYEMPLVPNELFCETIYNAFSHLFKIIQPGEKKEDYQYQATSDDPFASNVRIDNNVISKEENQYSKEQKNVIKMTKTASGLYEIPVLINGVLKIKFILDSGASEVSISPDVALTLLRTGTIRESDWLQDQTYRFADGSTAKSKRFNINEMDIEGNKAYNIAVAISNSIDAPMLLGQNVLSKFGKITIDYKKHTLTIKN